MADIVFVLVFVLFEILVQLIDCVVGKMHVQISHVFFVWTSIWHGCKPCKAIFVDIDTQRIYTTKKYVNSQIILQPINFMDFGNVFLHHKMAIRRYICVISGQKNAFALTLIFWLHDERPRPWNILSHDFLLEIFIIVRHTISGRKEVIIHRQERLHPHQMATKHIFSCQVVNSWEMIESLPRHHVLDKFLATRRWAIRPIDVPV